MGRGGGCARRKKTKRTEDTNLKEGRKDKVARVDLMKRRALWQGREGGTKGREQRSIGEGQIGRRRPKGKERLRQAKQVKGRQGRR